MKYANIRFCNNIDLQFFDTAGKYQIPIIAPEPWQRCEFVGFNYAKTATNKAEKGVHFFIDDYQFERIWHDWRRYGKMLSQFYACMTPDFSTYTDYPMAAQIWNHYRKHFVGAYLQSIGVKVYPTISWSDQRSYEWCFDGEPEGATVCVSSIGTQMSTESRALFINGYNAMVERLHPQTIVFYGGVPDECKGNIVRIKAFQERFTEVLTNDWN